MLHGIRKTLVMCAAASLALLPLPNAFGADTVVYSQGFESSNGGYTGDLSVAWEWGSPSLFGPPSANSGSNCWGTDLNATIAGTNEGFLTSPAVTVPTLGPNQVARVRFYAWTELGSMYDRGGFLISSDGLTWQSLAAFFELMAGGWQRYEFDISSYAGGTVYLRFRAYKVDAPTAGLYIDDVAIIVSDLPAVSKTFTLEGWENPSSGASCPWVMTWDGSKFVHDNDIYSVARGAAAEYIDYYGLRQPLVPDGGVYNVVIRELESEDSWTDMIHLLAVDHAADVAVAPDSWGRIHAYRPGELAAPIVAAAKNGADESAFLVRQDDIGFRAYSDDSVELTFPDSVTTESRLLLRVKGFQQGEGPDRPFVGPPAIKVQVRDAAGGWQEVGRMRPRYQWSTEMYDLSAVDGTIARPLRCRLVSVSHGVKYHEIDFVALASGPQPSVTATVLPMLAATYGSNDVRDVLNISDNRYVSLSTGNEIALAFGDVPRQGAVRDFVLVSEGYYVPRASTFFIYTWDGSSWVQRDGASTSASVDETMNFDLSMFLPDPDGEYKVRVWQDYKYNGARIDLAAMQVDSTAGTLAVATDLRGPSDILSIVGTSDDTWLTYGSGLRDRWTEYEFTGFAANTPPTTNPVTVVDSTISWTYADLEGSPQAWCEVEVWTGPGGTGTVMWDPPALAGTDASVVYAGDPLTPGATYYVRVRASDGTDWGGWSETEFIWALQEIGGIPSLGSVGIILLIALIAGAGLVISLRYR